MPKMSCWNLARGYPKVVTQITVHSAEGLEKKFANESKNCKGVWESKIYFHFLHVWLVKMIQMILSSGIFSLDKSGRLSTIAKLNVNFFGQGLHNINFYIPL